MLKANEDYILRDAVCTFGLNQQINIMIEEMSELTKELCKHLRGLGNNLHICEEIADVSIILDQMKIVFDKNHVIADIREQKLLRLEAMLKPDEGE